MMLFAAILWTGACGGTALLFGDWFLDAVRQRDFILMPAMAIGIVLIVGVWALLMFGRMVPELVG